MDKVRGGTPINQRSMCYGCRAAHVSRGTNREEAIYCGATGYPFRVNFPVVECSRFDDKSKPPLYEMQAIAWVVTSRNRGPVGFAGDGKLEITVEPPGQINVPQQPATTNGKVER